MTQQITDKILSFVAEHPQGAHTSEIAESIGHNRITVGKYLDILVAQGKVSIRRIGQAKVFLPPSKESRPCVLIVDDEPHVLHLISLTLGTENYEVMEAKDGVEALAQVTQRRPDIIVLDLMMPKMNGYEVCQRLKENVMTQHIPIIILSAKGELADKIKGMKMGADDYLTKPFDPLELEARISATIRREMRQRSLHPLTGLTDVAKTKEELRLWRQKNKQGKTMQITIEHLPEFFRVTGYKDGGEAISLLVKMIVERIEKSEGLGAFIGHTSHDTIVVGCAKPNELQKDIAKVLENTLPYLYAEHTIKHGKVVTDEGEVPALSFTFS